jgi:hypothetical protein
MHKGLVVIALLASAAIGTGTATTAAERGFVVAQAATEAPAAQKLVGLAAWNALVGNSVSGKDDGQDVVEFYEPNGVAKSMTGNEISTGQWALVGETVCFKYPDEDTDCFKIEVAGTTATFTDPKGTGTRYEILKGNPKGL